jgi:hypothetical protein
MAGAVTARQLPVAEAVAAAGGPASTPHAEYAGDARPGPGAASPATGSVPVHEISIWPDSEDRAVDAGAAAAMLAAGTGLSLTTTRPGAGPGAPVPVLTLRAVEPGPHAVPAAAWWDARVIGDVDPGLDKEWAAAEFAAMQALAGRVADAAGLRIITDLGPCGSPHWLRPRQLCTWCGGSGRAARCTICLVSCTPSGGGCYGIHPCLTCDGSRQVSCPACAGEGRIYDAADLGSDGTTCQACHDGNVPCPGCGADQ